LSWSWSLWFCVGGGFHRLSVNHVANFRCWGERRRLRKRKKSFLADCGLPSTLTLPVFPLRRKT
jgi:hypothetical protein